MAEDIEKTKMVWTCSECGSHYLMLPVITHEEYSINDDDGTEFWGEISDEEPEYVFEEEDGSTTAFCKKCQKDTVCVLKEFKKSENEDPNLLKDTEKEINETIKNSEPVPEDLVV